ncbi:TniB family NTP-binding protein [Pseudomonas veronii]|uniref:TniB family NTP-binding protein n=1 Tax=Pseudomonas veronii TaxID=76761 RepID=UPI002D78C0D0|nr:TniB family NTP-binding protein [Pseudomonas veronii]WRU66445.1 TniB family NTP-binding protein [Pseudomonas veronii]
MFKSDCDRIEFLDYARWIDYRAGKELLDLLHGLLRKPERPRMPNLFVVGESNCGKTTVIEQFISKADTHTLLTTLSTSVRSSMLRSISLMKESSTLPS